MFKLLRIVPMIVVFLLFFQTGLSQEKAMVIHHSDGSISTTKISNIDTLKFTEDFIEDIDGNVYKTVKIGDQWWMAENLKVTHYNDNTSISFITDKNDWIVLTSGAYCFYDNNFNNVITHGCLYNWYAVNTGKLAPTGWHVPTHEEWQVLDDYLTNNGYSGTEGTPLKSTSGWGYNGNGTDDFGFSGLPAGYRSYLNSGSYMNMGSQTFFWSVTEYSNNSIEAWQRALFSGINIFAMGYSEKENGFSVRCVRD